MYTYIHLYIRTPDVYTNSRWDVSSDFGLFPQICRVYIVWCRTTRHVTFTSTRSIVPVCVCLSLPPSLLTALSNYI